MAGIGTAMIVAVLEHWLRITLPLWLYLIVFAYCGILAAGFLAWEKQYSEAKRLRGRLETRPRLSVHFAADDRRCVKSSGGDETFFVGVKNDGKTRAEDVRLVLQQIDPPLPEAIDQPFLLDNEESFKVAAVYDRPTHYVPVFYQRRVAVGSHRVVLVKRNRPLRLNTPRVRMVLRLDSAYEPATLDLNLVDDGSGMLRPQ